MKNSLKKVVSMILVGVMTCALFAGCGKNGGSGGSANSGNYDEKISFTMTSWYSKANANSGYNIDEEAYVQWVMDKFNVEIDAWALASGNDALSKTRLWLNAGSTPDCFWIPQEMPVTEIRQYINLGLMKALPDDWKETWPNLAKMAESTGYLDAVTIDGKTYAVPHATYYGFEEMDPLPRHTSIHYRKDWAEQVGMSDLGADGTIKLSELAEYIKKVADAGLCSKPYLAGTTAQTQVLFKLANGITNDSDFIKTDNGYVFAGEMTEYVDVIKQLREWQSNGLLDPDSHTTNSDTAWEEYKNGLSPVIYYSASVGVYHDMISDIMKRSGYLPSDETQRGKLCDVYGIAAVRGEDGTVYSDTIENCYTYHAFGTNTDDATMVRVLDMMDYFCTTEGQIGAINGIPEVDWTMDDDGNFEIINEDIAPGEYGSPSRFFALWGTADDAISTVPGVSGYHVKEQEAVHKIYEIKSKGTLFEIDMDYVLLDTEAKNNYGLSLTSKVTNLVHGTGNIEKDWDAFLKENSALYKPVLEDLNK